MGGKSSAPAAPDYTGAANAQAAASQELATQQTWANRPTQNTPWGSNFWTTGQQVDPATGQPVTTWTQNQTLDPALQSALNDQLGIQQGKSQLAGSFMGRVADEYSQPFDWTNLPGMAGTPQQQFTYGRELDTAQRGPMTTGRESISPTGQDTSGLQQTTQTANAPNFVAERQRIEQSLFDQMRPEHQRQEAALQTQLANQGLTAGSEAYNQELARLSGQQSSERFNALKMGGEEQQRLQGMMMGQQQQAFGQSAQSQAARNQALQQLFAQQQGAGAFGLGAQQQAFGQQLGSQEAFNRAQQGMFGQDQAANQQNWQQMMQGADYQNRLRQQAIAEQQQARGMSLNELNALLTGQQVQNPQMPSFMGASIGQAPNLLGAAQSQYGAASDAFNADQASQQSTMSGIASIAGTAAMFF